MNQGLYNYKVGFKQLFKTSKYHLTIYFFAPVGLFKNLWESSAVDIAAKMYQLRI